MGFGHLLPEREDSYPAYQGDGEIENDLHRNDDDMIVVEVVDVEEEDDEDADKIDGKVEWHPDKRGKDELVSGLADAKDQQAACHNRDHRDEDVDAQEGEGDRGQAADKVAKKNQLLAELGQGHPEEGAGSLVVQGNWPTVRDHQLACRWVRSRGVSASFARFT